jgi:ABC-type transport system involved in Fe-S cluster assembly fused permease/ATPase subunit
VSLFRSRTVAAIAHQLQTVKDAHKVIALEDGECGQEGDFEALL